MDTMKTSDFPIPRHWWGKLILGVLGLLKGGMTGAVIGVITGHFIDRFIEDAEVPDIFAAADAAVLPYSADFRSASGVMHLAARMDVPVVASGGPGPLMRTMLDYPIGEIFEPLDDAAMARALQKVFSAGRAVYADGLEQLRRSLSWERNVDLLLEVAREVRQRRGLQ